MKLNKTFSDNQLDKVIYSKSKNILNFEAVISILHINGSNSYFD